MSKLKKQAFVKRSLDNTFGLMFFLESRNLNIKECFAISHALFAYYSSELNYRFGQREYLKQHKAGDYFSKFFLENLLEEKHLEKDNKDLSEMSGVPLDSIGVGSYEVH